MQKLRFFLKPAILLLTSLLLIIQPAIAQDNNENSPLESMEFMLNALVDINHFSGVALVAQNGEILLHQGYGYANKEWDILNTIDTKFRIGDLTTQFTAMSLLILHERGELDIHNSVCDYLDTCSDYWQDVEVRHLMQHTSGIQGFWNHSDFDPNMQPPEASEAIRMMSELPLLSEPGEEWNYFGMGYLILGEILENVSGMPFSRFLDENILEPLGMENTGVDRDLFILGKRAEGYTGYSADRHTDDDHIDFAPAFDAMYSTTGDLHIWHRALFNYEVISEETWNMMIDEGYRYSDYPGIHHYGIVTWLYEPEYFVFVGFQAGFNSMSVYIPSNDVSIIVLSNCDQSGLYSYADRFVGALSELDGMS